MTNTPEGGAPGNDGGAGNAGNGESNDNVSYETHQRLLRQKKKADEAAREAEAKLESMLLDKQKADGHKDEVITTLETKLEKVEREKKDFLRNMTKKSLRSEITKTALARGIQPEKLDLFIELSEKDFTSEESQIQVDENFDIVNRDTFEKVFETKAGKVSDWFTKQSATPRDIVPSGSGLKAPQKNLDDMDIDELAALL